MSTDQIDWVGGGKVLESRHFTDIRNTRESVAEEKARLCLELGELCNKIPQRIKSGGTVNDVRRWKDARARAMKVAGSTRSSVPEIRGEIRNMGALWD